MDSVVGKSVFVTTATWAWGSRQGGVRGSSNYRHGLSDGTAHSHKGTTEADSNIGSIYS